MSDSENNLLSHLAILDDLIQVIYQGHLKFVVLSASDDDAWTIHVGLTSRTKEGRWWMGQWRQDVEKIVGVTTSSNLMEMFAQKLKDAFTKGDMVIGNWDQNKGAEINLTLGTTEKKPLSVALTELSAPDAAAYASDLFFRIALQAQKRGCQLEPSALPAPVLPDIPYQPRRTATVKDAPPTSSSTSSKSARELKSSSSLSSSQDPEAAKEIKALNSQLVEAKAESARESKAKSPSDPLRAKMKARGVTAARPLKGASLANPSKRARKIKELEFGDSD
ncbi:hypothetical protein NEOLEDRAFT_1143001 [Neolentinus lepideus HHB14362 ss-1]|uniref:Uncharacterized protein n=1 Tax=Neolentinus lepideus HHB14362 ss-1 TaxID=1314782 RepID=A0A165MSE3_9AGAM|nr:hypothetical protein NEOLEDRAFT_1143001 [Neolentinus lepideus HHB14362 ss-1]